MAKKILIIGAGPGGLAAAMMLASRGFHVEVFEKKKTIGGSNSRLKLGDFMFDKGPTFLNMAYIAEDVFAYAGKNLHDYIRMIELTELYELIFDETSLKVTQDNEEMKRRIDQIAPGDGDGYLRFMKKTRRKMNVLAPILQSKMDKFYHYASWRVVRALPWLSLTKSLYNDVSSYFKDERIKQAFTFQSNYLGMSSWESPGLFSILPYIEHEYGVFHPEGGINQLSKAMAKAAAELGAIIYLEKGVRKLVLDGKIVKGVELFSGERIEADEVIVNSDFAHTMTTMVGEGVLKKYSKKRLENKSYSCSAYTMYLGLDKCYPLSHHTIVFANDYKRNSEQLTKSFELPDDPSIYIQNASVTDSTLAPEGGSALYIHVPVPNSKSGIDWEKHEERFRELLFDTIEKRTGFKDLRKHVVIERTITPKQWEEDMSIYKGAIYSLSHMLSQLMVLRPHNQFEELENCWLVGGATHPGSGLPTILESARITAKAIVKKEKH
ncbi:phytoene desaturase family protein [Bacillus gobiensis]|uniref:phytoene desaturase family protein n=1 Tax=Bacillus gobiensis TaxID=1441095 RepID=UPI003D1AA99F